MKAIKTEALKQKEAIERRVAGENAAGPVDGPTIPVEQYAEARYRWSTMGFSAILRCEEPQFKATVGMRRFLELADATQKESVGRVARETYSKGFGFTEDNLEDYMKVTTLGVTGIGFDGEADAGSRDNHMTSEAVNCPLMDCVYRAGYKNGDPELKDLSLWCDTYDYFESAAMAPSVALVHTHCLGRNERSCRWFAEPVAVEVRRKKEEPIYDYLSRMRESYRKQYADKPFLADQITPEEFKKAAAENARKSVELQSQYAPTLLERMKIAVAIQGRIGSISTLMAGELIGWDKFVDSMADKQGPCLLEKAKEKAKEMGITGKSVNDAVALRSALNAGQGYGVYEIVPISENRVEGTCGKCPIIEWGREAGLEKAEAGMSKWCSAAGSYEVQAIDENISQTYTHCLGKGDKVCRWVMEKK